MDRLPREAKDFLALTADGHDPPDAGARERVQARLAAMALLPMSQAQAATTREFAASARGATGWFSTSKVMLAGVVALTVGGGLWALSTRHAAPVQRAGAVVVSTPEPAPTTAAMVQVSQLQAPEQVTTNSAEAAAEPIEGNVEPAQPRARAVSVRRDLHPPVMESSLAQETALLRRASEQLGQGELNGALRLLEEHRATYHRSQLAEERNGLFVLAHCLRSPSGAAREARSFIRNTPSSLLVPRVVSACGL